MLHSYSSHPFSFGFHHATMRERVEAARYTNRRGATQLVLEHIDVAPDADARLVRDAADIVARLARGIKEGRRNDRHDSLSEDFVYDGFTVAETLASMAVDHINEVMVEAMCS